MTPLRCGGALAGACPRASSGLGSSLAGVRHGEGRVVHPFRSSPEHEGRRGGWAMMVKWRQG
jgi:hypothetical protein